MKYKPQAFRLPVELEAAFYAGLPLYILVAYWAMMKDEPVTVRDVRLAFHISLRRASDLLEYLTEQGAGVVQADCFLVPSPRGGKCVCRAWRVYSINDELARLHRKISRNKRIGLPDSDGIPGSNRRKYVMRTVNDTLAEKLEKAGLWRRAASRWLEVMQHCETDAQLEWVSNRRRYCHSQISRPLAEKLDIGAINRAASLAQQQMGIYPSQFLEFRKKK